MWFEVVFPARPTGERRRSSRDAGSTLMEATVDGQTMTAVT